MGRSHDKIEQRRQRLMPGGIPRWVRCYDNGGGFTRFCRQCLTFSDAEECDSKVPNDDHPERDLCGHRTLPVDGAGSYDRYTVVFTGRYKGREGVCRYLGMSARPSHPQGFGQHGESIDPVDGPWPPGRGDLCHLGRRITFQRLPPECQRMVLGDYMALWGL